MHSLQTWRLIVAAVLTSLAVRASARCEPSYMSGTYCFPDGQCLDVEPRLVALQLTKNFNKDTLPPLTPINFSGWNLVALRDIKDASFCDAVNGWLDRSDVLSVSPVLGSGAQRVIVGPYLLAGRVPAAGQATNLACVPPGAAATPLCGSTPSDVLSSYVRYPPPHDPKNGFEVLKAARLQADLLGSGCFVEPDIVFTGYSSRADAASVAAAAPHPRLLDDQDLQLEKAWDYAKDKGKDVAIVVLDDAVQADHGGFYKVVSMDFTGGEPEGCDRHGTAVAGCAAGSSAGSASEPPLTGAAPGATVISARVLVPTGCTHPTDGPWFSDSAWTVQALCAALALKGSYKAVVTNNSNSYLVHSKMIAYAYAETQKDGVTHFAAAGRMQDGKLSFPASLPSVLSIGGLQRPYPGVTRCALPSSATGAEVELAAAGQGVRTTDRVGPPDTPQGYATGASAVIEGTSCSSAIAAGVAALYYSVHPNATPREVADDLIKYSAPLDLAMCGESFGDEKHGVLNACLPVAAGRPCK